MSRYKSKKINGFSLIELLIVIGILVLLIAGTMFVIDPINQLNKIWDAQKKHDLGQIRIALDKYYDDHNCYPLSIPFGEKWEEDGVVYMKKVPKDDHLYCRGTTCYPYYYQIDDANGCPQWSVLYIHLHSKGTDQLEEKRKNCPVWSEAFNPSGGTNNCGYRLVSRYSYCLLLGEIDCQVIRNDSYSGQVPSSSTPTLAPTTAPTSTSTPTPTSLPTVTPTAYCCNGQPARYDLRGNPNLCNSIGDNTGKYCDPNCTILGINCN